MKLIKLNHKGESLFLPNCYPSEIEKDGELKFFLKGWQKAKKYEIVEGVELPEKWDKAVTWLDVAKFYDQYGLEVANAYAECKTAGIVSKQTAIGYGMIYSKIKHLVDETFDPKFFELLRCDYMMSCFGLFMLDIVALDASFEKLEKIIPFWLFDDGSSGQFDWLESRYSDGTPRAAAWKFNEQDEWNYDIDNIPTRTIYNSMEATYKGQSCSMREYVLQKYGQLYVDVIEAANK